jgi:hypothetical protein
MCRYRTALSAKPPADNAGHQKPRGQLLIGRQRLDPLIMPEGPSVDDGLGVVKPDLFDAITVDRLAGPEPEERLADPSETICCAGRRGVLNYRVGSRHGPNLGHERYGEVGGFATVA